MQLFNCDQLKIRSVIRIADEANIIVKAMQKIASNQIESLVR